MQDILMTLGHLGVVPVVKIERADDLPMPTLGHRALRDPPYHRAEHLPAECAVVR